MTGERPFPWQAALYERFLENTIPRACDIPTGLGKTSVIALWLLALLEGARVPRRLVYVVNRRTVVDQTTAEVERLRRCLSNIDGSASLALSTLRGAFADNREWSADPSRPAVISGTVDMIGSRLLFGGYGVGYRLRPLHAGFLGQDALLVHDEAHLEPAFQALVESIEREQRGSDRRARDLLPLRIMALTATPRSGAPDFTLTDQDRAHATVQRRIRATKALTLHTCNNKEVADKISEIALQHRSSGRAILVFARAVDDVEKIGQCLAKEKLAHARLTGTMRGLERDMLVSTSLFARFQQKDTASSENKTVYLVCTSAGEVGVNISADRLVCDLSTFDSMAQRFGRLNRFGARDDAKADVICQESLDTKDPVEERLVRTRALLERLEGDASPEALSKLPSEERGRAFAPPPQILAASDIAFDAWALTTLRELPGRPPVAAYLHGVAEWEPPRTQLAFRMEVLQVATPALRAKYPPTALLEDYPLKPHELLSDLTSRVFDRLKKMAAKSPEGAATPVWLVREDGFVNAELTLEQLVEGERDELAGLTLILPPLGGLSPEGFFDPQTWDPATAKPELDVADRWLDQDGAPRRTRTFDADPPRGMRLIRRLNLTRSDESEDEIEPIVWSWYEQPRSADNQGSRAALAPILLDVHLGDTERVARRIVAQTDLPRDLQECVALAARIHDVGKRRRLWQRSIGNNDPKLVLAKPGVRTSPLDVTGYRHELGSILDAKSTGALDELDSALHPLLLHLVAAHHGRARPHFPRHELFDPEVHGDFEALGVEVLTRFARLQETYGRWGLAYLESLLRAADYEASSQPSSYVGGLP